MSKVKHKYKEYQAYCSDSVYHLFLSLDIDLTTQIYHAWLPAIYCWILNSLGIDIKHSFMPQMQFIKFVCMGFLPQLFRSLLSTLGNIYIKTCVARSQQFDNIVLLKLQIKHKLNVNYIILTIFLALYQCIILYMFSYIPSFFLQKVMINPHPPVFCINFSFSSSWLTIYSLCSIK